MIMNIKAPHTIHERIIPLRRPVLKQPFFNFIALETKITNHPHFSFMSKGDTLSCLHRRVSKYPDKPNPMVKNPQPKPQIVAKIIIGSI